MNRALSAGNWKTKYVLLKLIGPDKHMWGLWVYDSRRQQKSKERKKKKKAECVTGIIYLLFTMTLSCILLHKH